MPQDMERGDGFGMLLRRYRSVAGLTQEELAQQSGLSVRALSNMERGRTDKPYARSVRLIADALGLTGHERAKLLDAWHGRDTSEAIAAGPPGGSGAVARQPVMPRQLPAAVPHFVGRHRELKELDSLLDQACGQSTGTVVVSAIGGTAGVGKTALALHWAHRVAGRYPDGQLYVNLRGYDPAPPVAAADALAGFLRALGVPGQEVPAEMDERAGLFRSLLAGRRMLVILDNAHGADQVRPLLPGTSTCTALVTSRDSMAGLVARDGALRVELDLLPLADAVAVLGELIGERAHTEPRAAAALAEQCSRLPLALRVAAELAAARPATTVGNLAAELADQRQRLAILNAGGDPYTAVRAVFSWSCRHLDPGAARTFRLLSLHPGPDFDLYAAAALTDTTLGRARRTLETLIRAHLIQTCAPSRYGMHDLLRAYARELAADSHRGNEPRAALTRLFDHYLHTTATAMDSLFPADRHRRPAAQPSTTPAPPLTEPTAARFWLDSELATLVAVSGHMAEHGWPGHATRLAATLFRYLDLGGHYPEAIIIHGHAHRAAKQAGDRAAEAVALTNLGLVDAWQGRRQQATGHFRQSLNLFRAVGDRLGEGRALHNLGVVNIQQGRYQEAASNCEEALALCREAGDRPGEIRALHNLSLVDIRQGRYDSATSRLTQALAASRETGDRNGEAHSLAFLADIDGRQGRYQQATDRNQQARSLYQETGDRPGEAYALADLGSICHRLGRSREAIDQYQQALTLFREIGDRAGEAASLNELGEVFLATGKHGFASARHSDALHIASQIGDMFEQARAYDGLARVHDATGHSAKARRYWQEALTRYTDLGVPEAARIQALLAAEGQRV